MANILETHAKLDRAEVYGYDSAQHFCNLMQLTIAAIGEVFLRQ